jgi:calcineurin-like phosphoesterase family protein
VTDIWFISDTHFSHANFLEFVDDDGERIRPFASIDEMDELMIARWNERVRDGDRVYHLGDVSFGKSRLPSIMARLRGSKRLILGNHDEVRDYRLLEHFKKVTLWRIFKEHNFVCTHIPLAIDQMRKVKFNVHGHIHQQKSPTERHINICVEQTGYAPVHLDELLARTSTQVEAAA